MTQIGGVNFMNNTGQAVVDDALKILNQHAEQNVWSKGGSLQSNYSGMSFNNIVLHSSDGVAAKFLVDPISGLE